ncbi:hypothetical protein C8J56DRAFT_19634 [Mycena floridula]|nr:hypothetical protein C8J56DRAFT_19634 [Mycena floridula]
MSAHPPENPWPVQTPTVAAPHSRKRRRESRDLPSNAAASSSALSKREITDFPQIRPSFPRSLISTRLTSSVEDAKTQCETFSGNDVFSCFPTGDSIIPQHQWAGFVWNSRLPDFTQTNKVNIYLFHADSGDQVLTIKDQLNPTGRAGFISQQVDDRWFGTRGSEWSGSNISYPFYWVVTRNDKELDGSAVPQAVFTAVQTTYADSVVSSMASTSAAAAASASSASLASRVSSSNPSSTAAPEGSLQQASASSFPHWAIAVIVVLGFLAIASSCILAFFIMRKIHRRNERELNRNSIGSESPMMANIGNSAGSPLLAAGVDRHSSLGQHPASVVSPDGASTISRVGSLGDAGPFSGADAAIMADAFRKALRKPDFAGRPDEEGESPDQPPPAAPTEDVLLNQQLAEEGRDIRSVSSSRGVKVETLSDSGDTAQDHSHQ